MSDDKIAEIRAQHKASDNNFIEYESTRDIHAHRAFLLAEVDRQRAEIEQLRDEDTKTRHALKGWVFVCPDGGDEPTHERVAAVVAEVERQRAEIERLRETLLHISRYETVGPAGFEWDIVVEELVAIARDALEGKP